MDRECLGILWGIKKFAMYLYGKQFTLQTDHRPLQFLSASKFVNPRIVRWALAVKQKELSNDNRRNNVKHQQFYNRVYAVYLLMNCA